MTAQEQSEAVVAGLSGGLSLTGRTWYGRRVHVQLNEKQVNHLKTYFVARGQTAEIVGLTIITRKCCKLPWIIVQIYNTPHPGFEPGLEETRIVCPTCGKNRKW